MDPDIEALIGLARGHKFDESLVVSGWLRVARRDILDGDQAIAHLQPPAEDLQILLPAFCSHLHPAIGQVLYSAPEIQALSQIQNLGPIAYALNISRDIRCELEHRSLYCVHPLYKCLLVDATSARYGFEAI